MAFFLKEKKGQPEKKIGKPQENKEFLDKKLIGNNGPKMDNPLTQSRPG